MKNIIILLMFLLSNDIVAKDNKMNFYDFKAKDIDGKDVNGKIYEGKVVLIVNTASKCGFTSQFSDLEALYAKYKSQGLEILGFPCNQFMKQDPGSDKEIADFCKLNYGVSFKMFSKINVNGDETHPLYKFLKSEAKGVFNTTSIKWNFTKFIVDRKGRVRERFSSNFIGIELENEIKKYL